MFSGLNSIVSTSISFSKNFQSFSTLTEVGFCLLTEMEAVSKESDENIERHIQLIVISASGDGDELGVSF